MQTVIPSKKSNSLNAFSLVELSIVVLIVGVVTLVVLNGKSLFTKASCVASTLGNKSVNDNIDNPSALTSNKTADYNNCVSGAFTGPGTISNLRLWIDASDASTLTLSAGSTVTTVKDKSSDSIVMTRGGGAGYPALQTASLNGLNTIYFNQTAWFSGSYPRSLTGDDISIFAVRKYNAGGYVYFYNQDDIFRLGDRYGTFYFGGGGSCFSSLSGEPLSSYSVLSIILSKTKNKRIVRINGSEVSSSAWCTPDFSSNNFLVGARVWASPTEPFSGNLGEFLIFNKALTDQELKNMECYMSSKWGIAVSGC